MAEAAELEQDEVRNALTTRLQMLLAEVAECIATELDVNVIDHVRDCSEQLYRSLGTLSARNPEMYSELLHQSRLLVDVLQRPVLNGEDYVLERIGNIQTSTPGRPKFEITRGQLEYLIEHSFTAVQIANMLGVSLRLLCAGLTLKV